MKVSDSSVQQDQQAAPAIAIVGMECNFPGAANLADFWHLICFGSVAADAAAPGSAAERLPAVIAAALANREADKEEQRQAVLRLRRQATTKLAADQPRQLQYRLMPNSRPQQQTHQPHAVTGRRQLM